MLLVGLGNPGKEYWDTRHNVGFTAVDEIIRSYSFSKGRKKFKAEFFEGEVSGKKVYAIKPTTFMNNSGISVQEVARFYKISLDEILVVHDELDIELGRLRIKKGGSAGGHNGIRSIDSHLGKDYRRLRIGIGHPGDKNKVHSYVLNHFAKSEAVEIETILNIIAENFPLLVQGEDEKFMTKIAFLMKKVKEVKEEISQCLPRA